MPNLENRGQRLSLEAIESSSEIQTWLDQFSSDQQSVAKVLLSRLCFVSRDEFSDWLSYAVKQLPTGKIYALFSVRKLDDGVTSLWDSDGRPVGRPGTALGSEDLVYSLISKLVRQNKDYLLDHPALTILKNKKIKDYVLIDDSIGSGDRVSGFVNAMLKSPTFLSWWSYGWVKIHVISYARQRQAELKIIKNIRGSDHGIRRIRKSSKISFSSGVVYDRCWPQEQWGENFEQIFSLCRGVTQISSGMRMGYGGVMTNIVFHHSVPNNLPGVIWCDTKKWKGLMPGRAMPDWLQDLLNQRPNETVTQGTPLPNELLRLLSLVKRGVRSTQSLSIRLNVDHEYALKMIRHAMTLNLLTPEVRLTPTGRDQLKKLNPIDPLPSWDRGLYIPHSWCAGRATVQPPTDEGLAPLRLADSAEASANADGDVGQASLERSDAKAASPPLSVMLHDPSMSREDHDTDGPLGLKG
jgi:hypothetical protein